MNDSFSPQGHGWRSTATDGLLAEDEGYAQMAQDILDAVQGGLPGGQWRMPWHGIQGGLPENAFSGRRFKANNLMTLLASARRHGFKANLWAPLKQWAGRRGTLKPGQTGTMILVPVFDKGQPPERWSAITVGAARRFGQLGGDPEGGDIRRMLGFRREPWFNIEQICGLEVRPRASVSVSTAARDLAAVLTVWRRDGHPRKGPALRFGGHQAHWSPGTDQICMPEPAAFADYDGLSGEEFFVSTLAHEHIHATGSLNRLNRESLRHYSSAAGRAREEIVAEIGAALLCGRFGLATALRPDHAHYVQSWLSVLSDRNKRKTYFWAVRQAEIACNYIMAAGGNAQGVVSGRIS